MSLGDSVPAATACACTGYVELVARRIGARQGRGVEVQNLAVGGATSTDVATTLNDRATAGAVAGADLVIVQVGANDFDEADALRAECSPAATSACFPAAATRLTANLTDIVRRTRSLQRPPHARIVLVDYWNVFRDGAVARGQGPMYVTISKDLTGLVNGIIESVGTREGAIVADAATPFVGDGRDPTAALADDADHPNAAGHELLASAVLGALGPAAATL